MDAIGLVKTVLTEALEVDVVTDIPRDRPQRLVAIALDGDNSTPYLLRPRILLTCWGRTNHDALGLTLSAIEALEDAACDHPYLSSAELETMSREEWSRDGQARYMAVLELTINVY